MDAITLNRTELAFLHRLLLDLQRDLGLATERPRLAEAQVAALELALAMLRWDGTPPAPLDAQFGLGAAVQLRLGPDAMCAYRQWRNERRRLAVRPR